MQGKAYLYKVVLFRAISR